MVAHLLLAHFKIDIAEKLLFLILTHLLLLVLLLLTILALNHLKSR